VPEFFAGKVVAITGGTGFLGQGIVEKLLRACPEIGKILLLIREKKSVGPRERLKQLAELPVSCAVISQLMLVSLLRPSARNQMFQ